MSAPTPSSSPGSSRASSPEPSREPPGENEVRQLARLARIAVDDAALPGLANDLAAVLGLVANMGEADVAGVEPMAHPVASGLRLRDDAVTATDEREALQRPAPEVHDGYYLVPRVVE